MWLLNTGSHTLEYFQGSQRPYRYAILSHRRQDEEVTFEDLYERKTSYTLKYGWSKIIECCRLARRSEYTYVWIDSCCIDKRSSAELSEAINSMYEWYAQATVCYTYLFDVHDFQTMEEFENSSWFRRSWTLQELLAPFKMDFFNATWSRIGSKSELSGVINRVTSIPEAALENFDSSKYSVAQRMSWAARREATRIEDVAYSLLGIFDINMPLLYGEGTKAFQRLQETILNVSNDLSLFVWNGKSCPRFGLLAASPSGFSNTGPAWHLDRELSRGYSFNNAGLSIELEIRPLFLSPDLHGVYEAYLHDPLGRTSASHKIVIYLLKDAQRNRYRRVSIGGRAWNMDFTQHHSDVKGPPVRVSQILIQRDAIAACQEGWMMGFTICGCPRGVYVHRKSGRETRNLPTFSRPDISTGWVLEGKGSGGNISISVPSRTAYGILGYLAWTRATEDDFVIMCFGFDFDFHPLCLAFTFPGPGCANPLMGLAPEILMTRYLRILPESSLSNSGTEPDSTMCAIMGGQRTNSRRDLLGLNLSVRFLPTKSSLCRIFIDFGQVNVPSTELPVRTSESMAKLRHLFGAPENPGLGTRMIEQHMAALQYNNPPGYMPQHPNLRIHDEQE